MQKKTASKIAYPTNEITHTAMASLVKPWKGLSQGIVWKED